MLVADGSIFVGSDVRFLLNPQQKVPEGKAVTVVAPDGAVEDGDMSQVGHGCYVGFDLPDLPEPGRNLPPSPNCCASSSGKFLFLKINSIISLFLNESHRIAHQSIAVELLYRKSFGWTSIRRSVRP